MADIGMAALSVFFMQSPSFLAHQRALAKARPRSNAHTLFGLARIPCDNHIRQLLDGVPTTHFDDALYGLVEDLDAHGALAAMRRLDDRVLIALDGTEYFRSRKLHCDHCSTRKRNDGGVEYFHQMVAAHLVAPGRNLTLPLPPAFIQPRDGAAKQDCERQAVKRWLARHGPRCAALRPLYLGDDLYACQPVCQAMLDGGGDFLLTAKPASHKTLYESLDGIRPPTRRRTTGRGAKRRIHRYRWMTDLPIRDGDDALRVNWLESTSARPDGTIAYRGAFLTSLDIDHDNVAELADCARARWKIENETFNVLKQHGYHPRTQLRPRHRHPRQRARRPQPARLRPARSLRTRRNPMAAGPGTPQHPDAPVRAPAHCHRIPSVPLVDCADGPARHRRHGGPAALTPAPRLHSHSTRTANPSNPTVSENSQNENCWLGAGRVADLRWSGLFGQSEGRNKVYRDCDVMPSGRSYPLPVTGVEVR